MLASTVLGGVMSIWSESRKAKAEAQKLLITRGEFEMKGRKQSLDHGLKDKGFAWTRRIMMRPEWGRSGYARAPENVRARTFSYD